MTETRACTRCGEIKPWTREHFRFQARQGISQPCLICHKELSRQWRKDNPVKMRRAVQRWNKENPHKNREYGVTHLAKHPRNGKTYNLPIDFTANDWEHALRFFDVSCAYCGRQPGLFTFTRIEAEHWIPLTDPRPNNPGTVPSNIVPACRSCNARKRNHDPVEWLNEQFGPREGKRIRARIEAYFKGVRTIATQSPGSAQQAENETPGSPAKKSPGVQSPDKSNE